MSIKAKIASVILFAVTVTSQYWTGFWVSPQAVNLWTISVASLGMILIIATDISVWLKLFLFSGIVNTIYAANPTQAILSLCVIVIFLYSYLALTKFKADEMKDLLKASVSIIGIQVLWVAVETLYVYKSHNHFYKHIDMCGTIGYVNLVAIIIASCVPLMIMYKKILIPFALFILFICNSYTSLGVLAVSMGMYLYERSRRYVVILLVFLSVAGAFGAPKLMKDARLGVWSATIKDIKDDLVFGKGWGSFKNRPFANVLSVRRALKIEAEKGDEKAILALKNIPKESYNQEFRYIDLPKIFSGFENPVKESEELIRRLNPNLGTCVAFKAHNTFLGVMREAGLITVIPLIGFIIVTVINFIRSKKTELQRAVFGALCGFYVGMMFDFPERNIPTMAVITVIIAANTALVKKEG